MVSDFLQDGAGPQKKERIVLQDRCDRSSRVAATEKVKPGKGNQDVDEDSSDKEVSKSYRRSHSPDGVLPIHGALGEVVEAAHGRYVPWFHRGGAFPQGTLSLRKVFVQRNQRCM